MGLSVKFLKDIMEPEERVVCRGGLHGIYLFSGLMWLSVLAGIGWGADYALWHYLGAFVPEYEFRSSFFQFGLKQGWIGWMFTAGGTVLFLTEYMKYISTDILVTTKRVIYKNGFLKVKIDQTDLSDVRGIHVDQGWLGQFLGYGRIHLDCRFVDDVYIPYVKKPYVFLKTMQKIKSDIEEQARIPQMGDHGRNAAAPQTIIQIMPSDHTVKINHITEGQAGQHLEVTNESLHDKVLEDFTKKH